MKIKPINMRHTIFTTQLIIILIFTSCTISPQTTLLKNEFYVYEDGQVFATFDDFETQYFSFPTESHHKDFDKNIETKRGIKIGSGVDDVVDGYGEIPILSNDGYVSLCEYLSTRGEESYLEILLISYEVNEVVYNAEDFSGFLENYGIAWDDYNANFNEIDKEYNIKSYNLFFGVENGIVINIFTSK